MLCRRSNSKLSTLCCDHLWWRCWNFVWFVTVVGLKLYNGVRCSWLFRMADWEEQAHQGRGSFSMRKLCGVLAIVGERRCPAEADAKTSNEISAVVKWFILGSPKQQWVWIQQLTKRSVLWCLACMHTHTHTANDTQTFLDVCITPYVNLAQTTEDMYDLTHEHVHMGNWVYKCLHIFVQTLSSHKRMHRNIHANTQTRADADIVETTTVFHVAWPKREETEIVCQESYSFQSENAAGSQEKATIYAAILWLHSCTDFQADNVKDGEKWHLLKFL